MQTTQRPQIVTLLGFLQIISGILNLIGGGCLGALSLFGIAGASGAAGATSSDVTAVAAGIGVIGGILALVTVVLAIASIVVGAGLLQLKRWAYRIAMIVAIINIVVNLIAVITTLTSGGNLSQALAGNIGPIAINAVVLYWLNRAEVKGAFGV
jgi:hypothetical protein